MNYFTRRNVAILALLQIGVIVFGVLAAGVTLKYHAEFKVFDADSARLWVNYGWFALPLPIIWVILAAYILAGEEWSDRIKLCAFFSGVVLLAILVVMVWTSIGRHWVGLS